MLQLFCQDAQQGLVRRPPHQGDGAAPLVPGDPGEGRALRLRKPAHQGALPRPEGREQMQGQPLFHGQAHRARVQHLGACLRQAQHIPAVDLPQEPCAGEQAGVGGVNAVHIGVDFTALRVQGGGQRHRRGVGAAAAQGGHILRGRDALEARHHGDLPGVQRSPETGGVDLPDGGLAVTGVGMDPGLPAGKGAGGEPQAQKLDGHQGGGALLAGGHQGVQLPPGRMGVDPAGGLQQLIGAVPRGGDHHDQRIPPPPRLGADPCRPAQPRPVRQGTAAEFLYDQHGNSSSGRKLRPLHSIQNARNPCGA